MMGMPLMMNPQMAGPRNMNMMPPPPPQAASQLLAPVLNSQLVSGAGNIDPLIAQNQRDASASGRRPSRSRSPRGGDRGSGGGRRRSAERGDRKDKDKEKDNKEKDKERDKGKERSDRSRSRERRRERERDSSGRRDERRR
jgi:hypothetical protein